jgi:plastocyanin
VLPKAASAFDSGNLDPKETFEHTFDVPGTYRYFCIPHEGTKMYGTVIVESTDG